MAGGGASFGFMLPILSGLIAMSIADRPGSAVGFVGGIFAFPVVGSALIYRVSLAVGTAADAVMPGMLKKNGKRVREIRKAKPEYDR